MNAPGGAVIGRCAARRTFASYIERNSLKAGFGVIGHSLEADDPAYFEWIKALHKRGAVEFWDHGYADRKAGDEAGEFEGSFEGQRAALERTQRLAKEKLGIELRAFGPHWSGANADTDRALAAVPEIRVWLYGPKSPKAFKGLSIERVLALENPSFVPDAEEFKALYERDVAGREVLVLQGHPNAWDDEW